MPRLELILIPAAIALLAACAGRPSVSQEAVDVPLAPASSPAQRTSSLPRYRCDHDIDFTVRFGDDTAVIDAGARGTETLLRDAGGVTPNETVYSSTNMKAHFGLGAEGREATFNYTSPPLEARCLRE